MPKVLSADPTPNENAMKFTVEGRSIESGSATFNAQSAAGNPIAKAVFEVGGIRSVFLLNDFVTVTKLAEVSWTELREPVLAAIESVA
jgi:hypothetical protein